jgi:hypothetical protein
MTLGTIVFAPFSVFIAYPLFALLPAALFAALYWASGRRLVATARAVVPVHLLRIRDAPPLVVQRGMQHSR